MEDEPVADAIAVDAEPVIVDAIPVEDEPLAGLPLLPTTLDEVLGTTTPEALQIHTDLRNSIDNLTNLAACKNFFDDAAFAQVVHILRSSQSFRIPPPAVAQSREEWARAWATSLHNESEEAWALNNCRKTALKLLFKVCNIAAESDESEEAQVQQIARVFEKRRLDDIIYPCLVMDRFNCLYNMKVTSTFELGLGWYAEGDEATYQGLRNPPLPLNSSGHTINKRFKRLQHLYPENDMVHRWLKVAAPERLTQ